MGAISQASTSAAANAGAVDRGHVSESLPRTGGRGEQRSSLGQLLLQFPLPVATSADVVAMKLAYYKKMIDGLRDFDCTEYLSRVWGGQLRMRNPEHANILRLRRLVRHIKQSAKFKRGLSARTIGGRAAAVAYLGGKATELDDLFRELALCHDRIAQDILTNRGGVLLPASLQQFG